MVVEGSKTSKSMSCFCSKYSRNLVTLFPFKSGLDILGGSIALQKCLCFLLSSPGSNHNTRKNYLLSFWAYRKVLLRKVNCIRIINPHPRLAKVLQWGSNQPQDNFFHFGSSLRCWSEIGIEIEILSISVGYNLSFSRLVLVKNQHVHSELVRARIMSNRAIGHFADTRNAGIESRLIFLY